MRLIFSSLVASSLVFGYYAKVEPLNIYNIKSDISGKIVEVNKSCEARSCQNIVIKVDDYQDRINLQNLKTQLKNFKKILKSQIQILNKKKKIYEVYKKLNSKSQLDKDMKFYDYQNSLIAVAQTKNTISNIKAQLLNLEDVVKKKNISFSHYIYKIDVNKGDYIVPGSLLATTMDINKVKLDIYVPINKISTIKNKKIYINGKISDFKIDKIYKVADEKFVTSYKVEIVGKYPTISDIVKVEFKN